MKELKPEPLDADAAAPIIAEMKSVLEEKNIDLNALDIRVASLPW